MEPRVLLVDDDDIMPFEIVAYANRVKSCILFDRARDVEEAVNYLNSQCYDAAILDVRLPGVTGVTLGAIVREHDPNIPLAYLTNLDSESVRVEAVAQKAFFLRKLTYVGSDEGMHTLYSIIIEMTKLNPCQVSGARITDGFARMLHKTPIKLPESLSNLLRYSRSLAAAA